MMYELRILNGLHRGATLPLDDHPLVIGSSETADVVLVDPGVAERHATLSRSDTGWILAADSGPLYSSDGEQAQKVLDLVPGECVRLGHVWLVVAVEGEAWQAVPLDSGLGRFDPTELEQPLALTTEAPASTEAASADDATTSMAEQAPRTAKRGGIRKMLYASIGVLTVLCAAAAYAISSKPPAIPAPKKADIAKELGLKPAGADRFEREFGIGGTAGSAELTPEQLRKAFRRRLSSADLLSRFDLTLGDHAWDMRADLDDDEAARFERVLAAFIKENHISFPVRARVVGAENMLPFTIRQVISGANASVVTEDGERLYVGDESHGMKVVSIQDNHLVFNGKRKVEVRW
ncbi:FHA domain-containing protein [Paraherbaspirillum soli]|uniref:FHA domain-containing protein n=1 Tax=Paraherbaspirillum soli TaxID=631222 RepID=A0ABW0MAV3_9BURK